MRILLADDEVEITRALRTMLERNRYGVDVARDGREALDYLETTTYDAVVLDIMMPRLDGLTVLRRMRAAGCSTPTLLLSARGEVEDRVAGLDAGADDYLPKPFSTTEFLARIRALLRRRPAFVQERLRFGDLTLDTNACVLIKDGTTIDLTSIEYRILKLFMGSPGRVFTKKQIYEAAWGEDYIVDDNNIMVYISKIREKLGERSGASYIRTIRGLGYKLLP